MDTQQFGSIRFGTSFGHDFFGNPLYKGQEIVRFEDENGAEIILDADNWDNENRWLHDEVDSIGSIGFIEDVLDTTVGEFLVNTLGFKSEGFFYNRWAIDQVNEAAARGEIHLNSILDAPIKYYLLGWLDDQSGSLIEDLDAYDTNRSKVGEE